MDMLQAYKSEQGIAEYADSLKQNDLYELQNIK